MNNHCFDADYSLDEPVIRSMLRRIHVRGHEIGFHPSYNTYKDKEQFCREAWNLRRVLEEEGIQQDCLGGRQHYLRWETPTTARCWEAAGLDYDSTLSFADHAGFRCGVCYEYSLYDLYKRKMLNVRERPLIVMEATLANKKYMGLGYGQAFIAEALSLKNTTLLFNGAYTFLWHNTSFFPGTTNTIYLQCIR